MIGDRDRRQIVRTLLALRQARCDEFPHELFDEFAWNILLHLFYAHALNEAVSVATISDRAGTSETAGRRWIEHLVMADQVESTLAMDDLRMTATAIDAMRKYVDRVKALGVEQLNDLA
ncbi:hypothetical protein [uncultured Sphingomonas sp.]|uniref:hypothetical protein n=1 Tax=uncultured Sphingomonas sp. TaxID=158754 RepID=UPI0035C99102